MNNEKGFTLIELMWALTLPFIIWLIALWTQSNINHWCEVDYSIWLSVFLTILFNVLVMVFNIISELFIFFS